MAAIRVIDDHVELQNVGDLTHQEIDTAVGDTPFVVLDHSGNVSSARKLVAGEGVVITDNGPGNDLIVSVDSTKYHPAIVWNETPAGTINGINKKYYLQFAPDPSRLSVFVNGVLQSQGVDGDFTVSNNILTFVDPLPFGYTTSFLATYSPTDGVVIAPPTQPAGHIIDANTLVRYRFYDNVLPLLPTDETVNAIPMAKNGTGTITPVSASQLSLNDPPSVGANFPGATYYLATLGDSQKIRAGVMGTELTIGFTLWCPKFSGTFGDILGFSASGTTGQRHLVVYLWKSSTTDYRIDSYRETSGISAASGTRTIPTETWVRIIITYRIKQSDGTLEAATYINGQLVGIAANRPIISSSAGTNGRLSIGTFLGSSNPAQANTKIGEVFITTKPYTDADVLDDAIRSGFA